MFIVVFYKQIYSLSKNFPEDFFKNCSLTKQIFPIKHNFLSTAKELFINVNFNLIYCIKSRLGKLEEYFL